MLKLTVLGVVMLQCAVVAAQNDSMKIKQLNPVVISATRTEKNLMDVGRSITVITSEQLQNSIYTNLSEVLSAQEGIYVVGNKQNPGMTQSIFTRGANSNQTIVMIDGVRVTDPSSTNNAFDLSELSLLNVERIEIVRGSHSTMYGFSSIGGVINIITEKTPKQGLNVDVEAKGGTFGKKTSLLSENVFLDYTLKNGFYANAGIMNLAVKGLDVTVDTVTNPNVFKHRDKDDFTKLEYNGKIGYKTQKTDAYIAYRRLDHNIDLDKSAYTDDDNYKLEFNRDLFSYGGIYHISKSLDAQFLGGYSQMKRFAVDDSSVVDIAGTFDHTYYDNLYKGTTLNNDLQLHCRKKGFEVVAGGGLYGETMTSKNYYYSNGMWGPYESKSDLDTLNIHVGITNAFAHAELNGGLINEKYNCVSLALGARYNNHKLFGTYYTYEINPSVKIKPNTLLYFSFSTGFNAPSLYQLYAPFVYAPFKITRGNSLLKPETSVSYEAGLKTEALGNILLTASYFYTTVDNSIEFVYLWDKNKPVDSLSFMDYIGDTYLNLS